MQKSIRTAAIACAALGAALALAGCAPGTVAPMDQAFVTNSAVSPIDALGSDHVRLVPLDRQLSLPEPSLDESDPAHQTIVLQCRADTDGTKTFGVIAEKNFTNAMDSRKIREGLAKNTPGCQLEY